MKKGFTLIEIIIYILILSIIILTLASFLIWAVRSNHKADSMREVLDNSRRAMEIMTYEIRSAKSIYIPTTTTTQISLETAHYLPEGENSTYIDFYLASSTLFFKTPKKKV